ncbi:MAG: dienelactone hydrolase family protein [Rubrivivax sp.]
MLVVHENRGLNPHIEDITRRLALDRFIAFAPDALAPVGGYPGDEDKARAAFATLDQAKTRADFVAAAAFLRGQAAATAAWVRWASATAAWSTGWRRNCPTRRGGAVLRRCRAAGRGGAHQGGVVARLCRG